MTHIACTAWRSTFALCCVALIAGLLGGCRRELNYNYINYAEVEVAFDWSKAGIRPDDATLMIYPQDGRPYSTFIATSDRETLRLGQGTYSIVAFNQKLEDFNGIEFRNIDRFETIEAGLRTLDGIGTQTIHCMPDTLAVASLQKLVITREMVEYTRSRVEQRSRGIQSSEPLSSTRIPSITFTPQCVTKGSDVVLYIQKIYNVRRISGFLTGFAESVTLSTRKTTENIAVNYIELNNMTYVPGSTTDGVAIGHFTTFGIRGQQMETVKDEDDQSMFPIKISVDMVLVDKAQTTIHMEQDITRRIEESLSSGQTVSIGKGDDPDDPSIILPDVEPEDNPGAFDPGVGDWGDEEDVDIEFAPRPIT